jgi:hypothetical protein
MSLSAACSRIAGDSGSVADEQRNERTGRDDADQEQRAQRYFAGNQRAERHRRRQRERKRAFFLLRREQVVGDAEDQQRIQIDQHEREIESSHQQPVGILQFRRRHDVLPRVGRHPEVIRQQVALTDRQRRERGGRHRGVTRTEAASDIGGAAGIGERRDLFTGPDHLFDAFAQTVVAIAFLGRGIAQRHLLKPDQRAPFVREDACEHQLTVRFLVEKMVNAIEATIHAPSAITLER